MGMLRKMSQAMAARELGTAAYQVKNDLYDPMLVVTTKVFKKLREIEDLLSDVATGAQEADATKMRTVIKRASKYVAQEMGRLQHERERQMKPGPASYHPDYAGWESHEALTPMTRRKHGPEHERRFYRTVDPDLITGDDI